MILVGFAFGGQPLVGYNYGANNRKRLHDILKFAYIFEIGLALLFTIVMSALAPVLIRLFMNESQIIANGAMMLRCQQIGMMFMGYTGVLVSQACADVVTAVIAIGIMRKILKS